VRALYSGKCMDYFCCYLHVSVFAEPALHVIVTSISAQDLSLLG